MKTMSLPLSLVGWIACVLMLVGCEEASPEQSFGVLESPASRCEAAWKRAFDECMNQCIGLGCLEALQYCTQEADRQTGGCRQALGLQGVAPETEGR